MKLNLPRQYDRRYRINVGLPPRNIDQHLKEQRHRGEEALTRERVTQFKQIMLHYLDFVQKQKVECSSFSVFLSDFLCMFFACLFLNIA